MCLLNKLKIEQIKFKNRIIMKSEKKLSKLFMAFASGQESKEGIS